MTINSINLLWPDAQSQVRAALPLAALDGLRGLDADCDLLGQLALLHRSQWALEDQTRSRRAADAQIARCKREIDRHNSRRHQLIDAFDATYRYPTPQADARLFSETPGEECDRLLILSLKVEHTRLNLEDATLPTTVRDRCRLALKKLLSWQEHLGRCLVETVQALSTGRAILPPRSEFKIYNDPWLNPVTRLEVGNAADGSEQPS
jgi:hypothetical protein